MLKTLNLDGKEGLITKAININNVTSIVPVDKGTVTRIYFINGSYLDIHDTIEKVLSAINSNSLVPNKA